MSVSKLLRPNDLVLLNGPLGAGKTRFVQGLAAALECDRAFVNSPTFVLVQEYDGRLPIYHIDAYRLRDGTEFLDLGGDEYLTAGGVVCIEWAERIADVLPKDSLDLSIEVTGDEERRFAISAQGGGWVQRLAKLSAELKHGSQ